MGRRKKDIVEKSPFKLRRKRLADGRESLYLDRATNGKHEYEFLQLYVLPETTCKAKRQNAQTLRKAEEIARQRTEDLLNSKIKKSDIISSDMTVSDWLDVIDENRIRRGVRGVYRIGYIKAMLSEFRPEAKLKDIDKQYLLDYFDWLRTTYRTRKGLLLATRTAYNHSRVLRTLLSESVRSGIIASDPWKELAQIEKIKLPQSKREFLTVDEVKRMIAAPFPPYANAQTRNAFLFSCFCGLRLCDIRRLRWRDITSVGGQWFVSVVMAKTTTPVYIPLSQQAVKWLPERGEADADSLVFSLPQGTYLNRSLRNWAKAAGITKHISFHCARHTAATMMLTLGADLYTVSKILGHTDIRITQVYAKIVDKKKDDAVALFNKAFE